MKQQLLKLRSLALLSMLTLFSVVTLAQDDVKVGNFNINFATLSQAQEVISQQDDFINNLNQLDIDARLGKAGTLDELVEKQKASCREFTDEQKTIVVQGINRIVNYLKTTKSLSTMPDIDLLFVKTTMEEELDAGAYTRGATIYLGESMFEMSDSVQMHVLAHELCHVLTRNFSALRTQLYEAVGFEPFPNGSLSKELLADISDRCFSNPDVEFLSSFSFFKINGSNTPCSMCIFLDKDFLPGDSVFESIRIGLIALDDDLQPLVQDGESVIYSIDDAADFYTKMGRNTDYVIAPEECIADNFAFLVNGIEGKPNPEILERIQYALQQPVIDVEPTHMDLETNATTMFLGIQCMYGVEAVLTPNGIKRFLQYKVSDPDVFDIEYVPEEMGYTLIAKKVGTAELTIWCDDYPEISASVTITVVDPRVVVEKDFTSEDISTASLDWNDTEQLTQFIKQYCGVNMPEDYTFVCTPSNPDIKGFRHYECKQMLGNDNPCNSELVVHTDANGKMMYMTGQVVNMIVEISNPDYDEEGGNEDSYAKKIAKKSRKAYVGTDEVQIDVDTYYYGKDHLKVSECIGSKDSKGNYILQIPGKLYTLNCTNNLLQENGFEDGEHFANFDEMLAAGENFTSATADFSSLSDGIKSNLYAAVATLPESYDTDATYHLEFKKCKFADLDKKYVDPADTIGCYDNKSKTIIDNGTIDTYLDSAIKKGTLMDKATGVAIPGCPGMLAFEFDNVQFSTPYREQDANNEVADYFYAWTLTQDSETIMSTTYPLRHSDRTSEYLISSSDTLTLKTMHSLVTCQPAMTIHWSLQRAMDCFKQRFGIDSFDDQGTPLVAMVNYTDNDGDLPLNALAQYQIPADGSCGVMMFGMGQFTPNVDKDLKLYNRGYYPFCMMDLTTHEYTHLVARKLGISEDASALNESYADIMGKMVERMSLNEYSYPSGDDNVEFVSWKLGQVNGGGTPQSIPRRFNDPYLDEHPKFYHGKYWQPNGDMHANAGVQNYWFYLLCNGGTVTPEKGETVTVNAIDRDKAELITFSALKYFGMNLLDYPLARKHSIYATRMYYGENSEELKSVFNAWYAVGVGQDEWQPGMPLSVDAIYNVPDANANSGVHKVIKDGRIVIVKNGTEYTTTGIRLK